MARLLGPKCRICRREGVKLFLKGSRCETVKCGVERTPSPPGQHGHKRTRYTDYGSHLREKQKLKRLYGISERQFKRYFREAMGQTGNTGDNLLIILERRLDNVVFYSGLAVSRAQARQIITHRHILVNDKKVNITSYPVKAGDIIKPAPDEQSANLIKKNLEAARKDQIPSWLKLETEPVKAQMVQLPARSDIVTQINEQLVVEFASR